MRKRRRKLLFLMPLLLLLIFGIVFAASYDYSQIKVSSVLNYPTYYNYAEQFGKLTGDLSASGVPGPDSERPAFLDRWQATFTENLKTGASYSFDKYDVYVRP